MEEKNHLLTPRFRSSGISFMYVCSLPVSCTKEDEVGLMLSSNARLEQLQVKNMKTVANE